MTKASDNQFPKIILTEQDDTPATPVAGDYKLFYRSSDHALCVLDALGVVRTLIAPQERILTIEGELIAALNPLRIYNQSGVTRDLTKVFLSVDTAPTGAAILVDIHKNGTTIFTNQAHRPTIPAAAQIGSTTTIDVPAWPDGSYLQMQIDQVGSIVPGSNLTVIIVYI